MLGLQCRGSPMGFGRPPVERRFMGVELLVGPGFGRPGLGFPSSAFGSVGPLQCSRFPLGAQGNGVEVNVLVVGRARYDGSPARRTRTITPSGS